MMQVFQNKQIATSKYTIKDCQSVEKLQIF